MQDSTDKISRVLEIYTKLLDGKIVNKSIEAHNHNINERSIQRDIEDIRYFFDRDITSLPYSNTVIYDKKKKSYRLEQVYNSKLTNPQVLSVCKILLESRAFIKEEMQEIIDKLISSCIPKDEQETVKELIRNEAFHYIEPKHKVNFTDNLWTIAQTIKSCNYISIDYLRLKDKAIVTRKVKPLSIMFSEYYFYLTAFIEDKELQENFDVINDSFPTIYRIDRIKNISVLDEKFHIPYASRFEEGEFRKRVQFMYGGKLQKIKFHYKGLDIDSILDRLPTAKVLSENNGVYTVEAEVFGKGIDMWIRSQGDMVELI